MRRALVRAAASLVYVSTRSGYGSGCVVRVRDHQTFVLTCAHVVGKRPINLRVDGAPATALAVDEGADLALVRVDSAMPCRPIHLAHWVPRTYSRIALVSHPADVRYAPSVGTLGPETAADKRIMRMVVLPALKGSSGGPVVNRWGRLIALLSGGFVDGAADLVFNYAVTWASIRRFLAANLP